MCYTTIWCDFYKVSLIFLFCYCWRFNHYFIFKIVIFNLVLKKDFNCDINFLCSKYFCTTIKYVKLYCIFNILTLKYINISVYWSAWAYFKRCAWNYLKTNVNSIRSKIIYFKTYIIFMKSQFKAVVFSPDDY